MPTLILISRGLLNLNGPSEITPFAPSSGTPRLKAERYNCLPDRCRQYNHKADMP